MLLLLQVFMKITYLATIIIIFKIKLESSYSQRKLFFNFLRYHQAFIISPIWLIISFFVVLHLIWPIIVPNYLFLFVTIFALKLLESNGGFVSIEATRSKRAVICYLLICLHNHHLLIGGLGLLLIVCFHVGLIYLFHCWRWYLPSCIPKRGSKLIAMSSAVVKILSCHPLLNWRYNLFKFLKGLIQLMYFWLCMMLLVIYWRLLE